MRGKQSKLNHQVKLIPDVTINQSDDQAATTVSAPEQQTKKDVLSTLIPDVIGGPFAGNADSDPETHPNLAGFLNLEDQNNLGRVSHHFFYILGNERTKCILSKFLLCIAHGQQDKAEGLLNISPEWLFMPGIFTDYSGRTFNCTAYEYAYWAKDAHMCRMLEAHMNEPIKTLMLERCKLINHDGLTYKQHGEVKNSKTFSFDPLINAYNTYIQLFDRWEAGENLENKVTEAWMAVGVTQRDVPVHVINEYCDPNRSFDPKPTFNVNKDKLPRETKYYDYRRGNMVALFPLVVSGTSGLGVDFTLFKPDGICPACACVTGMFGDRLPDMSTDVDLAAIIHLDVVRTDDMKQSLEILGKLMAPEPRLGCH